MSRSQISKNRSASTGATPSAPSAARLTLGDRVFLKLGRFGAKAVYRLISAALLTLVLLADYLLVLFTAVNVVPNIGVLVQQGTGMTMDLRPDAWIAGWLIPVLFIVAAVFVAEIFFMRRLWRFAMGRIKAVRESLFRLAGQESGATQDKVSPIRRTKTPAAS